MAEVDGVGFVGIDIELAVEEVASGVAVNFELSDVDEEVGLFVGNCLAVDGDDLLVAVEEFHVVFVG